MTAWILRVTTRKYRSDSTLFVACGYFFSILYALAIIVPLYFVVVSAFKNNADIIRSPLAFPVSFDFHKFVQAQASVNLLRALAVSTGVTVGAELLTLLLAFPAAYAVARIQTRLSAVVEAIFSLGFSDSRAGDPDADLPDGRQSRAAV